MRPTFSSGVAAFAGRVVHASRTGAASRTPGRTGGRARARAAHALELTTSDAAWIAALPTAAITLLAILVVGRPLGAVLLPLPDLTYFPDISSSVHPEPTEQARYLIALTAPLLHLAFTTLLVRRPPAAIVRSGVQLARAAEVVALVAVAAFFVNQRTTITQFGAGAGHPVVFFKLPTLVVAAAIAGGMIAAIRSPQVRARCEAWLREQRSWQVGAVLVAIAAIAVMLLPAIVTDSSIARAYPSVLYHLQYTYDESMAVLNGRSPMGDFVAQYASLWPYAIAATMSVLGSSLLVFTGLMAVLAGVTSLAIFDVLRRVTRSSVAALLLFLPLLATSSFHLQGPLDNRLSLVNYFGVLPLRYAGPFLLVWLVARHLDGSRPRRAWPLFLAGGLVVLNNPDFGIAALGATIAALLWTRDRTGASWRRLAAEAGAGLVVALALVVALLLIRTGAPPHFALLFRYAQIFARGGFAMLPMQPVVGLSTIIFLTYAMAIAIGTVRAMRSEPDRLLTGLLVWSGVFGLGAGSYYVGHSLPELITYLFPAWGLTLTLLTVIAVRRLAAREGARPTMSELACLFGFGLLVCSLAQTPTPWGESHRLSLHGTRQFEQPVGEPFVAKHIRPGEPVLVFTTLGHRVAENVGADDVEPYTGSRSVETEQQLRESLQALQDAGGSKIFVWPSETYGGQTYLLERDFTVRATEPGGAGMQMWVRRDTGGRNAAQP